MSRIALVLGGAPCVRDDVAEALKLCEPDGVIACNDMVADWAGDLDAAVSIHTDKLVKHWLPRRSANGFKRPTHCLGWGDGTNGDLLGLDGVDAFTDWRLPGQIRFGSSGLYALKVALIDLGYDKAIVCGCPLQGAYSDPRDTGPDLYVSGWCEALPFLKDKAKSMSGITAALLGTPTPDWIAA